ncbi:hypothetical protein N800_14610 [Lysobacter daejeonensis GH1-9]|uniref:Uncharacterized protein n=2 Tax=Aerolutibacter TaxID=3382701 RepID=A0A0A0EK93_9GAMM|nr:hypothetical protein N800_14610 [Lysobacter daejeonensis GH1-9]
MAAFWILVVVLLLFLSLVIPAALVSEPLPRRRAMGMSFGLAFFVANLAGAAFVLYMAAHGVTGVGRRLSATIIYFSDSPIVFSFALLVALALPACLAAVGWQIFRGAQRGSAGL